MPRKFYRKFRKGSSRDKYSVEQRAVSFTTDAALVSGLSQQAVVVVPPTDLQGMRKVKHLTASLVSSSPTATFYWALVYVPQGTTPNPLSTGGSLYEPNQFVMNCGIIDNDAGPMRISTPLSRNLNSGDAVYLVVGALSQTNISMCVRYAITLQ